MSVCVREDRSITVSPNQVVKTAWVPIDQCRLGCRVQMSPEAVEKKFRKLLNLGDCAAWPPIVGHWDREDPERFVVDDGRHEYLASLMMGRDKVFVCWLEGEAKPEGIVFTGMRLERTGGYDRESEGDFLPGHEFHDYLDPIAYETYTLSQQPRDTIREGEPHPGAPELKWP